MNILRKQVFAHPNEIIVVLFHRASFVFYVIFSLFCLYTIATKSIPEIVVGEFRPDSLIYLFIGATSIISGWACSTFPHFGRVELYSSSILIIFLIVGEITTIIFGLWAFSILSLLFFIVPVTRVLLIYILLVKNAKGAW